MKKKLVVPKFKSEKEEREFWQKVDSTEYLDNKSLEHWRFPKGVLSS